MNRLKLLIASLFAVALGTGVVVGMGVAHSPKAADHQSRLAEELNLTPAQNEDLKNIWSEVSRPGQSSFERRRQYQKDRDDALQALLTDDQKAAYSKIVDAYNGEIAELNHEREQAFQAAVESTKLILNDTQRAKYDEIIKRGFRGGGGREGGRGIDGREGHEGHEGPWHGASTRHGGGFDPASHSFNSASSQSAPQAAPEKIAQ